MIFGRLYTIIFSARIQELPSLRDDVKKLVGREQGYKGIRGRGTKVSKEKNSYGVMEYRRSSANKSC
jgi:hypothetical protein